MGEESQGISIDKVKEEFSDLIGRASFSDAYLDYCAEIYGYRMCLFNMMDKSQLDFLFNNISVEKGDSILDLGCGNGAILNHLMQKYDCHGVGIDLLDKKIFRKNNRLATYIDGNLDELESYDIFPSITISVDSLYFCNELNQLLNTLTKRKGNRLYLFYSQYIFDEKQEDMAIIKCGNTRLAASLRDAGIKYEAVDYSENERNLYERAIKALPGYEEAFKQEGNRDIFEKKYRENQLGKELYDKGCASRFLYIIE